MCCMQHGRPAGGRSTALGLTARRWRSSAGHDQTFAHALNTTVTPTNSSVVSAARVCASVPAAGLWLFVGRSLYNRSEGEIDTRRHRPSAAARRRTACVAPVGVSPSAAVLQSPPFIRVHRTRLAWLGLPPRASKQDVPQVHLLEVPQGNMGKLVLRRPQLIMMPPLLPLPLPMMLQKRLLAANCLCCTPSAPSLVVFSYLF